MVGVDGDDEQVTGEIAVPSSEPSRDALRIRVVQFGPDIEGLRVVYHPDLGALARGITVLREVLAEVGGDRRAHPDRVVQMPVDPRGALDGTHGANSRWLSGEIVLRHLTEGGK